VASKPYILALCSHKGGTGRSTATAALAWCFGQAGLAVHLVDADPMRAVTMIAGDANGVCSWPNVRLIDGMPEFDPAGKADLWVVDCPSLMEPASLPILERATGLILTCLPDPLSLRTVPAAAGAINEARIKNPNLELSGILLAIYDDQDVLQSAMLSQLRERHGELLIEPPVPIQAELRDWPLNPGGGLPAGPASDAFRTIARTLENWIRASVQV